MKIAIVFMIWLCISIILTIGNCEKVKFFGGVEQASQRGTSLDLFNIIGIGTEIYLMFLLWDSGTWWLPLAIRFLIIAPVIRKIYNI